MGAAAEALLEGARQIAKTLRENGFEAYFAGGCVRDLLLERPPKDVDLVTDAQPAEVSAIFKRTVQVGAAFGVVRVLAGAGHEYEIATYRTETDYSDGRRPDRVAYSKSKEEDVQRRDFTINALLMDPVSGEVLDFVGGREDLGRKLIRAVGDPARRFYEDRLRMLRAIRFAARLDFTIDPATFEAIRMHAQDLRAVSAERITAELHAMWATPLAGLSFRLLLSSGLVKPIFPFLDASNAALLAAAEARFERLTAATGSLDAAGRAAAAWALLLDLASTGTDPEEVLTRMKQPRDLIKSTLAVLHDRAGLRDPSKLRLAERVRRVLGRDFAVALAMLDASGDTEAAGVFRATREDLVARPLPAMPLVSGQDLMQLGHVPGPQFKTILGALEDEVYERRIENRADALSWVKKRFSSVP